jgi:hypothetical protein
MATKYKVDITSCSHHPSGQVGYAEGTINKREFVASWSTWQPLGGIIYDTWLDTRPAESQAIAAELRRMKQCKPVPRA